MKKLIAVLFIPIVFSCRNGEPEDDHENMKDTASDVAIINARANAILVSVGTSDKIQSFRDKKL